MGGEFSTQSGKLDTLSGHQAGIEYLLGQRLRNLYRADNPLVRELFRRQPSVDRALNAILKGQPTDLSKYFEQSVLQPSLRAFDREIAPRIGESFARHGASLSSRRGLEMSRALGDVHARYGEQLAGATASAYESAKNRQLAAVGIPLQQTLGRIGGLTQMYSPGLNFLGQQTTALTQYPGLGQTGLSMLGQVFGSGLLGSPGTPAAGAGSESSGVFKAFGK